MAPRTREEGKVVIREHGIECLDIGAKGGTSNEEEALPPPVSAGADYSLMTPCRSSSPSQFRDNRHLLSTSEDEGTKVMVDHLVVYAPSTPIQHAFNPSVRVSIRDESCESRELQPATGDGERFGGKLGSSHCCSEVSNGYLAHFVRVGVVKV